MSTPGASPLQSPGFRHNPKSFNPIAKPPCSSSSSPAHQSAAVLSHCFSFSLSAAFVLCPPLSV
ncbi:unnamed protein product, partial [Sphagnum jensenii]